MTSSSHEPAPRRLDEIPTQWSLLRLAHRESLVTSGEARNVLVLRYARAIRNYVGALVRDQQEADELAQEVVMRLLKGQFAAASPDKGSFRRMLMVAAHNLVRTHYSRKGRQSGSSVDLGTLPGPPDEPALEAEGLARWKQAILELAWKSLEEHERAHPGSIAFTVLRLRAERPDESSEELAATLSATIGRSVKAEALRQQLRRARLRFVEALLEEVARGLDDPTPARVEEELIEVGLMPYVRDLLPDDWRTRGQLKAE